MTDNRANEPNRYAGFLARQNHQRDPWRGIGAKCLCGKVFDLDANHAMHQVDEILRAALVAAQGAGVAPQEPRQDETKSCPDFVSLDPEKVGSIIDHAAEAVKHIEWAHGQQAEQGEFEFTVRDNALIAQAEATLALVEQQRIANLIAAAQMEGGPYRAINKWPGAGLKVTDEIKEVLGL